MRVTVVHAAVIGFLILLPRGAGAQELTICDPESALRRRTHLTISSFDVDRPGQSDSESRPIGMHLQLVVSIESGGFASAGGAAQIHDGTSSTFLVTEKSHGPSLSCGDADQDGIAGLTSTQFTMQNVRTGATVLITILPADGEIDESGVELVTLVITEGESTATLQARQVTVIQDL
jgi:hypothetical protein